MIAPKNMLQAFDTEQELDGSLGDAFLAAAPPAADVDEAKLEDAAARHRVLLIRTGAVIALTSLIAIGGAILFHLLAAGIIVIGLLIPWHAPSGGSGHSAGASTPGSGGALILGSPLADASPLHAPLSALPASAAPVPAAVALPPLPAPLPDLTATPVPAPDTPFPATTDLGTLRIPPPTPTLPNASVPTSAVAVITPSAASIAGTPSTGATGNAGSSDGEPLYSQNAGDGSRTIGAGGRIIGNPGAGTGDGHDYGASYASRQARIQRWPDPAEISPKTLESLRQKKKGVGLQITIEPDGTVSSVKVVQSCGFADVDELVRADTLATMQWSPAFAQGKPVRSKENFTYDFDPRE